MKILIILLIIVGFIDLRQNMNKKYTKEIVIYFVMVAVILALKYYLDQPNYTTISDFVINLINK